MQPAARYAHHRHFIPDLAKGTLVGKPVNEGRGPMSGTEWASILDRAARCFDVHATLGSDWSVLWRCLLWKRAFSPHGKAVAGVQLRNAHTYRQRRGTHIHSLPFALPHA